jgi:hypothetical protein
MDFVYPLIIVGVVVGMPSYIRYRRLRNDPRPAGENPNDICHSNAPLLLLRHHFIDRRTGLLFYVESMQGRYSLRPSPGPCVQCGRDDLTSPWGYVWSAHLETHLRHAWLSALLLPWGLMHLSVVTEDLGFCTAHWFCPRCARRMHWRRLGASWVKLLSDLVLIASGLVGIIAMTGRLIGAARGHEWTFAYLLAIVAFGLGLLGRRGAFRLQVPRALQFLRRRPFYFRKAVPIPQPPMAAPPFPVS